MIKTPRELAETMLGCIDKGDWAGVMAITSPNYVVHEPPELPFGGDWKGQDALIRLFPHVWSYWDDVVVDRLGILTDENYFCLQLRMTMTSKLTGKRISTSLAETTRCVDGLMVEYTIHYHDCALVAREAGPPRPGAVKLEQAHG
ncbi:MAG: nuclear transport factor 2 family protein [Novosphingobium sp.]|nr:nuclear transport factor 2 family protein [Novosphingobium sp.]